MNKYGRFLLPLLAALVFSIGLHSCKKVNESTELGSGLIPEVDNINTFDTVLTTITNNLPLVDSSVAGYTDDLAVGSLNDPEFGQTNASIYFNLVPAGQGVYPFVHRDSVEGIDSVVLSLAYRAYYGDSNSTQTIRVYEIAQTADFHDTVKNYKYSRQQGFDTIAPQLGSKTYLIKEANDSATIIRKRDTSKVANVVRIPLNISLGQKLRTIGGPLPTAYPDDKNFYNIFRGLAVIPDANGQGLVYFNLSDQSRSKLTVYYRLRKAGGVIDTTSTDFYNGRSAAIPGARANVIRRTPAGNFLTYLNNGQPSDDKLFIQSSPGSYASIDIPGLSTLSNRIVHRAELIITRVTTPSDNLLSSPPALFLDKITTGTTTDSAYSIIDDLTSAGSNGSTVNFNVFGGLLRNDQTYRFNLTRHVQDIITRKATNYRLRLYAPFRTNLTPLETVPGIRPLSIIPAIAYGRVVVAGGSADPAVRLRLRIIYSVLK